MRSVELIVQQEDQTLSTHFLTVGDYVVGRDPTCHITVPNAEVSRRHARVTVLTDDIFVEDLNSANGTFLEGHRIREPTSFKLGQRIRLGTISLECRPSDPLLYPGASITIDTTFPEHKYETVRRLAEGGMGVIFQASDMHIRRQVAMKVIHGEKQTDRETCRHFIEEAQVTGQLQHPNIVPVYELGMDEQGFIFYTMKFVKGVALNEVLEDLQEERPAALAQYSLTHLLTIFQKVCDAVAYAHSKGVIHRDLKPGNIMIGEYGEVMVMDWGLALLMERRSIPSPDDQSAEMPKVVELGDLSKSKTGPILGTPNYMSPEQARGHIGRMDARSDIFSLGAILYSVLTLDLPVESERTDEVLTKIVTGDIVPPLFYNPGRKWRRKLRERRGPSATAYRLRHCPGSQVPESLSAVVMKAMAVRPEDRYQGVKQLQWDIEAYQSGFITSAEETSVMKEVRYLIKRHKVEAGILSGGFAILVVVVAIFMVGLISSEKKAAETLRFLQKNAQLLYGNAEELVAKGQIEPALDKVAAVVKAFPNRLDALYLQARLLQCSLRLEEAREVFDKVSQLDLKNRLARPNSNLCARILKQDEGRIIFSPASVNLLYQGMVKQNRKSDADLMKQFWLNRRTALLEKWKIALDGTGIPPSKLQFDPESDLLTLDLRQTTFKKHEKLADFPIRRLLLSGSELADLKPLKESTLRILEVFPSVPPTAQPVKDLEALRELPITNLILINTQVKDLEPLKGLSLNSLALTNCPVKDLEPLARMPLKRLDLTGCNEIASLSPLKLCAELEQLILPPKYKDQQVALKTANPKLIITLTK